MCSIKWYWIKKSVLVLLVVPWLDGCGELAFGCVMIQKALKAKLRYFKTFNTICTKNLCVFGSVSI